MKIIRLAVTSTRGLLSRIEISMKAVAIGLIDMFLTQGSWGFLGALSGIAIHHGLFIHGEWHNQAPEIFCLYTTILTCVVLYPLIFHKPELIVTLCSDLRTATLSHFLGLTASILIYRRFFHPLNKINLQGPQWARYSKIWQIWLNRDSKNHLYLHQLYQKYGDVVQTGMTDLKPKQTLTSRVTGTNVLQARQR